MATDATGTPTSLGIRKYNTSADAPSGLGFNGAMDDIDALLVARVAKSVWTTTGDILYASGASTPVRLGVGSTGQVLTVAGGVPSWAAATGGLAVLADLTLSGSQASIDTNTILGGNLPTGYSHLKVVILSREDTATTNDQVSMRINNDSAGNYDYETTRGNGAATASAESFAATSLAIGLHPGSTVAAGIFGSTELLIPQYNGTVAQKTMTGISSAKSGTAANNLFLQSFAGFWRSSAAITRLTFLPGSGNFIAGTRITVYGMI